MQIKNYNFKQLGKWCPDNSELSIPVINKYGYEERMYFNDEILGGHVLVVGAPGSGKTTFLLHLAKTCRETYPDALFVFLDVKSDFLPLYQQGDMLCSFYPRKDSYQYFKWNLLDECLKSAYPEDELREITAKLFKDKIQHSGSNQFFPMAASQIFKGYFLTMLRRVYKGKTPTHKEISTMLKRMTVEKMRTRLSFEEDLAGVLSNIASSSNSGMTNQAAGVMAEFNQFISSFFVGMLADEGHDTIADFINGQAGKALFLEYDMNREETANILFRTLLDILIKNKLSPDADKRKIFLFLDEFSALKGEYSILNALHVGRGNGLRIIGALQSKEQVYSICPGQAMEHNGMAIIGGFSSLIAFHPNDAQTISYIQERIGEDIVSYKQFCLSRYEAPHVVLQHEPLVSSREINSLQLGEAYVKLREYDHRKVKFTKFA